jgi:outer membrane scaffolding protein for murein synthesis (MipA/OmpV family)
VTVRRAAAAAALCLSALFARHARADQPLWDFGFGVGTAFFNDYRGASAMHGYPLPVPYFIYRGDILRADRDGVHGRFLDSLHLELDVSANATAPVFSRHSAPRAGMPNLASTVELGPSLIWHVWRSDDRRLRFDVRTPIRNAITIDSPPRSIGWIASPVVAADYAATGRASGWNFGMLSGPIYQQRQYNDYFYSVAPQFATATRPGYQAPGGYAGTQALIAASKRYRDYWFGAYLRHDWLQGAVFNPSALVQQRSYWSGGFGFVWMIRFSSRTVESDE